MSPTNYLPSAPQVLRLRGSDAAGPDDRRSSSGDDSDSDSYERTITSNIRDTQYRLLVPVLDEGSVEDVERLMQTAALIADEQDGDVLVLCLVTVPEQTPYELLSDDEPLVQESYETAEHLLQIGSEQGISADALVCLTHRNVRAVLNIADRYECDGLLINHGDERSQRRRLLTGNSVEKLVARAECDVFVEKLTPEIAPIDSIFLTVSGGPHSGLAAKTARTLALAFDAPINAVHFMSAHASEDEKEEADEIMRATAGILSDVDQAVVDLVTTEDPAEEIISRSDEYDLTVLGAPTMGLLRQFIFGTVPDSVNQRSENAVLMVKQNTGSVPSYYRWLVGDRPASAEDDISLYECQQCGTSFEEHRQVCPNCGGYDIQREWTDQL